jgi:hypothetical protein
VAEPTHISEILPDVIEDILERADTPEEIAEDTAGWNNSVEEPADEGFPVRQYTDAEIDEFLREENAIVRRSFIERAQAHVRWIERSGIEQVQ